MINEHTGLVREGVTVFKSVGHGIADLATAEWLLRADAQRITEGLTASVAEH